jgi:hypothetical protein
MVRFVRTRKQLEKTWGGYGVPDVAPLKSEQDRNGEEALSGLLSPAGQPLFNLSTICTCIPHAFPPTAELLTIQVAPQFSPNRCSFFDCRESEHGEPGQSSSA